MHQAVCIRLNVDPETESVTWDSYRNPEGRWVVTAFHDGTDIGTWIYEDVGRSVHPQDEAARALMGGGPTVVAERPTPAPQAPAPPAPAPPPPAPELPPESAPEAAPEPVEEAQPARPRLVSVTSDPLARTAPRDDTDSTAPESPESSESPESPVPSDASDAQTPAGEPAVTAETAEPPAAKRKDRPKRTKGKRGRASVPSWDEILFGATKPED